MYYMTLNSATGGGCYHHDAKAGHTPIAAAHAIETEVSILVGHQSVDVVRLEPVYEGPDDEITEWVETGGPVRLWRELVRLRDEVTVHETARMGSEAYAVVVRGSADRLLIIEVEWHANAR